MKTRRENWANESDEALMAHISRGNRMAFETLYHRYFDKLLWFAKRFLFDTQKAEDIVQDVFIRLMKCDEAFDTQRKFSTWVYAITANRCKNMIRDEENRRRILQQTLLQNETMELPQTLDADQLNLQLTLARNELSAHEKMLLTLRFEQELSIKEIAQIQNKPEGTIKSGLYNMLRKLAAHLKEFSHDR